MTNYIAIYAGIGVVVGAYVLFHQYYFFNEPITVKDIIRSFGFCLIVWPPVALRVVSEFIEYDSSFFEKLLNKVVIKRKK